MKNTKEITTGAMLLAIFGAVLLIDRYLSFMFTDIISLIVPVVIIVFGNMFNAKDGLVFSIALLLMSIAIETNPQAYFFLLMGAIAGNIFNFLITKGANSFSLILTMMVVFSIAEILNQFVISSVFYGQSVYDIIFEYTELIKSTIGNFSSFFTQEVFDTVITQMLTNEFVAMVLIISCIITGVMEGLIVYIISIICFKRFKISVKLGFAQIMELKPITAYILFGLSCLMLVNRFMHHPIVSPILSGISLLSMLILAYYGYIYLLMYTRIRFNKNYALIIIIGILFFSVLSIIILFIIGFLYGTGPLKKYLVIERKDNEQN